MILLISGMSGDQARSCGQAFRQEVHTVQVRIDKGIKIVLSESITQWIKSISCKTSYLNSPLFRTALYVKHSENSYVLTDRVVKLCCFIQQAHKHLYLGLDPREVISTT